MRTSPKSSSGSASILYDHFPLSARKIVFGAGFAGYTGKPDIHDGTWDVHFVRGPQTAEVLNLDPGTALTDAAVLVRTQPMPAPAGSGKVSFMPHFESLERGHWQRVCKAAGIQMIDPRQKVDAVLAQMLGSRLLLTEAMHGAIVADALRVPWIPLTPIVAEHRFKWFDWTRSVAVPYRPVRLLPSSLREALICATGYYQGKGRLAQRLTASLAGQAGDAALVHMAAARLRHVAGGEAFLSRDSVIERLTDRAVEMVARFRQQ